MAKYIVSDTNNGTGNFMIADSPEEAFTEYREYYDDSVNIEDLFIYRIDCELKGKALYTFEEVGT